MTRPVKRTRVRHDLTAAALRNQPGEWLPVSTHRALYTAWGAAQRIVTASRSAAYAPAGSFEAEVRPNPDTDETAVYARYVGGGETA